MNTNRSVGGRPALIEYFHTTTIHDLERMFTVLIDNIFHYYYKGMVF